MEQVFYEHGFKNVEFKLPVHVRNGDGAVVAHYLRADHRQSFALRWINFPGHYRTSRFVFRED